MVPITALWLPILLSAVIVFVASSIIHMALPIHKSDYRKLPEEDRVLDAIRSAGVTPGRAYHFPYTTHKEMKSPEAVERFKRGPVRPADGDPQRTAGDGEISGAMVPLLLGGRRLCRLPDRTHAEPRHSVPGGFPCGRHDGLPRIRCRTDPRLNLERPVVERDLKACLRRLDLRAAHRRHVRVALAEVALTAHCCDGSYI